MPENAKAAAAKTAIIDNALARMCLVDCLAVESAMYGTKRNPSAHANW
jgi:hypothetical protein